MTSRHSASAAADASVKVQNLLLRLFKDLPREHAPCPSGSDRVLDFAVVTSPDQRDPALVAKLDAIAGRVLRPS